MIKTIGILLFMICGFFTGQAMAKKEQSKYQNGENLIWMMKCMLQSVKTGRTDMPMIDNQQNMALQWDFLRVFKEKYSAGNPVKFCYFTAKQAVKMTLIPEFEQQTDRFFAEFGTLTQEMQLSMCETIISACSQILQANKKEVFGKAKLFRKVTPLCFAVVAVIFM